MNEPTEILPPARPTPAPADAAEAGTLPPSPAPAATGPRQDRSTQRPDPEATLPPRAESMEGSGGANGATAPSVRVAGYEILSELGRGAMGVVYKARHLRLNRLVALKMILSGGHAGTEDLARFRTEAEAVARLQHPNIVQIYEVGEQDGLPFFALEFVGGGSLDSHLEGAPLPPHEAAALVETLAHAMHYAHQQGVIHRDLKPANILLHEDGERRKEGSRSRKPATVRLHPGRSAPKVTDFGLAKRLDDHSGRTQEGSIMGTPSYMAPEQAGGRSADIGPVTDVYALGAILYELLTGRPPFRASTPLETVLQATTQDPVPPTQLQPRTPRDLETVCLKCLEKDRRRRYPDAATLAEELRRFQAGEPIQARPAGALERAVKWARRRPTVAALSAGLLLLAAVTFGLVTWQWRRAEAGRHEAEAARQSERDRAEAEAAAKLLAEVRKGEAERARAAAEEQQRLLQRMTADLALDRGLSLCDQGDPGRGLLWLTRSLETAPADAADLRHAVRRNLAAWRGQVHPLRAALDHDRGGVYAVAVSPDGKSLLSGGGDHSARMWDLATGKPLFTLEHPNMVRVAAFSRDGKLMLTGCDDKGVRVWNAASGKQVGKALVASGLVRLVAYSPDGKTVVTAGETTAHVWDAVTGKALTHVLKHPAAIVAVDFQGPAHAVVTLAEDKVLRSWEGSKSTDLPVPHPGRLLGLAFSADGKTVATAGTDGTARLWEVDSGRPLGAPLAHPRQVYSVAFTPDGKTLVTGCQDGHVRLWEVVPMRSERYSVTHGGAVHSVAFSPDGATLLTGSADKTVRLWQAATGRPVGQPLRCDGIVYAARFSPDGKTFVAGCEDGTAQVRSVEAPEAAGKVVQAGGPVRALAFSPDGKLILTGGGSSAVGGSARLWQAATGEAAGEPLHFERTVTAVAFSPDGALYAVATAEGGVQVHKVATGEAACPPLQLAGAVFALAFSPTDRAVLAAGGGDKTARLWDFSDGQPVGPPLAHEADVRALAFSPDGTLLASGSVDQTARLWDVKAGRQVGPALRHRNEVLTVAFSPDGAALLTGGSDRAAHLWSLPPLQDGDPEPTTAWAEALTGLELTPEGTVHALDAAAWRKLAQQER